MAYAVRLEFSSRPPAQSALAALSATVVLFGPEGRSQTLTLSKFQLVEQNNRVVCALLFMLKTAHSTVTSARVERTRMALPIRV